jgi:hypothetical protein
MQMAANFFREGGDVLGKVTVMFYFLSWVVDSWVFIIIFNTVKYVQNIS